jgi:protein TonB
LNHALSLLIPDAALGTKANDGGENVRLLSSDPSGMFDNEVRAAMEKWRYVKGKPSSNNIITIHFMPGPPCVEVPAPNQPGSIQSSGVPFR